MRIYKRPAGRMWLYDFLLLYGGSYSFLMSHYVGTKKTFDPKLEEMANRMIKTNKKVNPNYMMDYTILDNWKCYLYLFDLQVARFF